MRRTCQRYAPSLLSAVRQSSARSYSLLSTRSELFHITNHYGRRSPHSLIRPFHQISSLREQAAVSETVEEVKNGEATPITRFEELGTRGVLHRNIVQNLKDMGVETMTDVQSATINSALKGDDIIAQAKTGTGKTLAFLLPVLQNIINVDPSLAQRVNSRRGPRSTADDIRAIVISPTRELAEQIAVEARKVVRGTGIVVQTAVGGTQKAYGLRAIQRQGCHILVGTPGRLYDILSDERTRVEAPDLSALVLDEADRLLDQGFWDAIKDIMSHLPNRSVKDRQTLMFSATVPREIQSVVRSTLKPGYQFVQCVREDEAPTHDRVPQHIISVNGMENKVPALIEFITRNTEKSQEPGARPFKAIVYCNSTADVALTTTAIRGVRKHGAKNNERLWDGTRIEEIHAKLSQTQRTRAAENFRNCTSGILLSSDVTARGMDFPNVTHVIQMSTPPNREQYIHRIGRTARAGKDGVAVMFLTPTEKLDCMHKLRGLKLIPDDTLQTASVDMTTSSQVPAEAGEIFSAVQKSMAEIPDETKSACWKSLFGANQALPKRKLVSMLNDLAVYGWGMEAAPSLDPGVAKKLGLLGVPGLMVGEVPRGPRSFKDFPNGFSLPPRQGGFQGSGRYSRGGGSTFMDRGGRGDSYGGRSRYDRGDSYSGRSRYDRGDSGYGSSERTLNFGADRV